MTTRHERRAGLSMHTANARGKRRKDARSFERNAQGCQGSAKRDRASVETTSRALRQCSACGYGGVGCERCMRRRWARRYIIGVSLVGPSLLDDTSKTRRLYMIPRARATREAVHRDGCDRSLSATSPIGSRWITRHSVHVYRNTVALMVPAR